MAKYCSYCNREAETLYDILATMIPDWVDIHNAFDHSCKEIMSNVCVTCAEERFDKL